MSERKCEDCGQPISICNAITSVNVAVARNGKAAVSAALARADLCADPALLAEAVEVLRKIEAEQPSLKHNGNFNDLLVNRSWLAARAFIAKLENRQ